MCPITYKRKPQWLRVKIQGGADAHKVNNLVSDLDLHTVCIEANCPNRMECYNRKTATFMVMGRHCTRRCRFCNVTHATPTALDPEEPQNVADAVVNLGLKHAVITSVTRDDLPDGGAAHFVSVVKAIRHAAPNVTIELLIPDLQGNWDALRSIIQSGPDVLNHNIETVPQLYAAVRPEANFEQSLNLLLHSKELDPNIKTKSGIMLGLGETFDQVMETLMALRKVDVDLLTIGQYLQPSEKHYPVQDYIRPEIFDELKSQALLLGFKSVASAPLVRSSYHADELV